MKFSWANTARNSLFLLGARVGAKLATVLVMIAVARYLGVGSFGTFSALIALASLAGIMADFGLVLPSIRSISKNELDGRGAIEFAFSTRIFFLGVAVVLSTGAGVVFGYPIAILLLFAASSFAETFSAALIRTFEAVQDIRMITRYTIIERVTFLCVVLSFVWFRRSLVAVGVAYIVSNTLMLLLAYELHKRRFGRPKFHFSTIEFRRATRLGLPFFITAVVSAMFYKADTILLGYYRPGSEVGIYNAALKVVEAQMFIPMVLMTSLFPMLSYLYSADHMKFLSLFRRSAFLFAGIGIVVAVIMIIFSPQIIRILYADPYRAAAPILRILSMMLGFYIVNFLLSQTLIAMHFESWFTATMTVCALASIVANMIFIPRFGYVASAWIRLCLEGCCTVGFAGVLVWKQLGFREGGEQINEDQGWEAGLRQVEGG